MRGHGVGGLYQVDLQDTTPVALATRSHTRPTDLVTWH
jgi:hypothetical protein